MVALIVMHVTIMLMQFGMMELALPDRFCDCSGEPSDGYCDCDGSVLDNVVFVMDQELFMNVAVEVLVNVGMVQRFVI